MCCRNGLARDGLVFSSPGVIHLVLDDAGNRQKDVCDAETPEKQLDNLQKDV